MSEGVPDWRVSGEIGFEGDLLMKNLKLLGMGVALALATTCEGQAQNTVDWAKTTCDEVMRGTHEETMVTGAWLSGYFHGLQGITTVDVTQLGKNTEAVLNYCSEHPKETVMDAVRAATTISK
jgi:hypothetical protein